MRRFHQMVIIVNLGNYIMNPGGTTNAQSQAPRERRNSRRAGPYKNSIALDGIIDENDPIEARELCDDRAAEASTYLRTLGITVVDVLRHDFHNNSREVYNKKAKKWFNEEGSVELLELCGKWCNSEGFKRTICELATAILRTELDKFISMKKICQPTTTTTSETLTTFSLHTLSETMTIHAPLLSRLFQRLVISAGFETSETPNSVENGFQTGDGRDQEEWLESDDEAAGLSAEDYLEKKAAWRLKQKTGRWVTALSTICYAAKRSANLHQMVMGYYLVAANTPKRVLEVLHQLGVSVSYKSVVRTMKTIGKISIQNLRNVPSEYPRVWVSFDNMDFSARVRDQRLDHQGSLRHYCAGYVAINQDGGRGPMLTANDVDMSRAARISERDLFLSHTDQKWQQNSFAFGAYNILKAYCGESMSYMKFGKLLEPVVLFPKYQIPVQKTFLWTLPVYARNEAEMAQMSELLHDIMATLGLPREKTAGKKIFTKGDLFTVIRSRLSLY